MSTRTFLLFGVLLCGIAVASAEDGKGKGKWTEMLGKWKDMLAKCHDDKINVEEAFKGVQECQNEAKDKQTDTETEEEERRRRRSPNWGGGGKGGKKWENKLCIAVCAYKKQKILDESTGQFNEAGCKEQADNIYPEKYRADMIEKMKKCNEEHSSTFSMDDNCKGYLKFMKCAKASHKEVCGLEWKKGKGKGKGKAKPKESDDEAADEE